jgi:hypothetical protein
MGMQRRYELMDVVVVIGICATIIAGAFMFLAANGQLAVFPPLESTREQAGAKNGRVPKHSLVDHSLHERDSRKIEASAVTHLNAMTEEYLRWQKSPFGSFDSIRTAAVRAEADHAIMVQTVMGRSIINFTRRGQALPSVAAGSDYNARMLIITEQRGHAMERQFIANWQPNLGRAIIIASQNNETVLSLMQERLGTAIVRWTALRTAYEGTPPPVANRLASARIETLPRKGPRSGVTV